VLGVEALRQTVESDVTAFAQSERTTKSGFAGLTQSWAGQKLEGSWRRDEDDQFGRRDTGSAGYGLDLPGWMRASITFAHGYRAPTFFDLYGPPSDFYQPNPALRPEKNETRELSLRALADARIQWRATAYDNRIEDLIVFVFPTVRNVSRARIRGVEGGVDLTQWGVRFNASLTLQDPVDEDTGKRLHGRATHFGALTASRTWGNWTAGLTVHASGDRYDSPDEREGTRLPGYATADARVRYTISKQWTAELTATNITDKRYETSIGYEGARRGVMLSVRFEAF
jgi:vitamin B12 transporter